MEEVAEKIYIAGPMSDCSNYNFDSFEEGAESVKFHGFEPVSPAEIHGVKDDWEWEDYLKADISLLMECDAIALLPGWEESKGACLEFDTAKRLGLQLLQFSHDLKNLHPWEPDESQPPPSILTEAQRLVYGPREADYGHPYDDYTKTAALWSVILETKVTAKDAALCMVAVKISREVHRPKRDNLIDMAGYAAVADRIETYEEA